MVRNVEVVMELGEVDEVGEVGKVDEEWRSDRGGEGLWLWRVTGRRCDCDTVTAGRVTASHRWCDRHSLYHHHTAIITAKFP